MPACDCPMVRDAARSFAAYLIAGGVYWLSDATQSNVVRRMIEVIVCSLPTIEVDAFRDALHRMITEAWGDDDTKLKIAPPGSPLNVQVCYLISSTVYLNGLAICNEIEDEKRRAECKADQRDLYCELISQCTPEAV